MSLLACNSARTSITDTTITSTITGTRTAPRTTYDPPRATVVPALPPGVSPAVGEKEQSCPYIASSYTESDVSVAAIEGNRVYRTVVLEDLSPVGCRFFFWAPPFEPVADILPRRFSTPTEAHDAMVLTGRAGTDASCVGNMVP